jgi:hypothetical protein
MNEQDLRDCFAMFAMVGLFMKGIGLDEEGARQCYAAADAMLEARKVKPEEAGIVAIKLKRNRKAV